MAGILDDTPVGMLDPRSMALMQMGLGLMQSSGPSLMPTSLGQSLGQAGMQGMQAFQQANQANQQQQIFAMKQAEAQKSQAAKEAFKAQFPHLSNIADLDMGAALTRAYPTPEKPGFHVVNGTLVRTDGGTANPVFTADPKDDEFSRALKAAGVQEGSPQWQAAQGERVKKLSTHQPPVQVINPQEKEFDKAVGKEMGGQYSGLMQADFSAPATISKYERLGSLLGSVNTGTFKGKTTDLKAAAKGLGIDLSAMGVSDDVAPAQAARALTNQLALEMRNPAGGAGMPGAMSDKDREFLVQMIPGLESDPGSIKTMVDYRVRLAKREQQVAKMARAYRKKNGKFDEGFFDEMQEWSNKNPLFPEAGKAGGFELSPEGAAALKKYGG